MYQSSKSISPVVATALLLVVVVVSVVSLQNWFLSYQSDLLSSVEEQRPSNLQVSSILVSPGSEHSLFLKNDRPTTIKEIRIQDGSEEVCRTSTYSHEALKLSLLFDEGEGNTSMSEEGIVGTLHNGTQWVEGNRGSALQFNPEDETYFELPFNEDLNTSGNVTFAANIKWNGDRNPEGYMTVIYNGAYYDQLGVYNDSNIFFDLQVDGSEEELISLATAPVNTWSFVAGTFNGTHFSMYQDGEFIDQIAISGSADGRTFENYIGSEYQGGSGVFNGAIDEAYIINDSLNEEEMEQLYRWGTGSLSEGVSELRFDCANLSNDKTYDATIITENQVLSTSIRTQ